MSAKKKNNNKCVIFIACVIRHVLIIIKFCMNYLCQFSILFADYSNLKSGSKRT